MANRNQTRLWETNPASCGSTRRIKKVEVKSFDHFLSDTFKKEGSNVDSQTKFLALMHEKKLRTQHYGKSYVPPASRSAVTYGARELRYREKEGGALAVEMKTLALREKESN